jgi:alanyl-tRNA synthetase
MTMTTSEIRTAFLDFFKSRGHQVVASSSLVPQNDKTLLFTNAGMNQFKDVFLGKEKRSYTRATTAQKCVRAGGKHNDLDNVGYTARHHTFFEMLGNFSFGDYFKKEVIPFAWEFLTEVIKLPADRLTVTVYQEDDEAYAIWRDVVGLPEDRIIRIGDNKGSRYASDNFWQMGDTGPCGPCTEIFYDHGADIWGGPPGSPEEDGDRYIEIWNIVFMQFNRLSDGTMEKLPKPSVDTGMGLERIAAVLQGVHNNYDIDLFRELISFIAELLSVKDLSNKSLRVIADHIRSCAFLIADGVMPSNDGRGYVLRRIIRRAIRHGRMLGAKDAFFCRIVSKLAELMGDSYPELRQQQVVIEKVLRVEEEQFAKTLDRGLALLEDNIRSLGTQKILPGEMVFKLYDTYGFPADLTADVIRDRGYTIDEDGFEACMKEQRNRAKENSNFKVDYNKQLSCTSSSVFDGYTGLNVAGQVLEIFADGKDPVESLAEGGRGLVVLDRTSFYGEKGGQIGDNGVIASEDGSEFVVTDAKILGNAIAHVGYVRKGSFSVGQSVEAQVNVNRRRSIAAHHSATHLLQAALRRVVGEHVAQKGSYVADDRLRFDFSHYEAVKPEQLKEVERLVNEQIRANNEIVTREMSLEEARKTCAMALFDEKYDDVVRVVSMGDFSMELCGGTHAKRTGDIGSLRILSEGGIAAGVRRIEAVVAGAATDYSLEQSEMVLRVSRMVKGDGSIVDKVQTLIDRQKQLEHEISLLNDRIAAGMAAELMAEVVTINGVRVISAELKNIDEKNLRNMLDDLKNRIGSGIVVLGTAISEDRVSLIAGVTSDLTARVKAGELISMVASYVGGKGGGRPDLARAGGTNPANLGKAIAAVSPWLEERL